MDWDAVREEFPITRNYNFQNHAGAAPISRRAAAAARKYFEHAEANSYVHGGFYKHADRVRAQVADLINANADEVTFTKSTSEGISLVAPQELKTSRRVRVVYDALARDLRRKSRAGDKPKSDETTAAKSA